MNGIDGVGAPASLGAPVQIGRGTPASQATTINSTASSQFLSALAHGMDKMQADSANASNALAALATRPDIATHDVILAMEQARLSLQLAGEVRQRLVDAYKEITGMQI